MNPYFDIERRKEIESIEELVSLNIPEEYDSGIPGKGFVPNLKINPIKPSLPFESSGIFRGQVYDWPLIPKCFRNLDFTENISDIQEVHIKYDFLRKTHQFQKFCKRAESQNSDFPQDISDRMSIAQHFGVPTPLLDWSQNVLTAVFFAIREVFSNSLFERDYKVFLYHVRDERYLYNGIPNEEDLPLFEESVYLKPYPIDRRIERQKAIFTYHPHPELKPSKVPMDVYTIDWKIIGDLIDLMKGFGFTEDYYFPDYAGIANAVTTETSL